MTKVELSINEYLDWKWGTQDDIERMERWAREAYVNGWKGIKEEIKKLGDIPEGYLPKTVFVSGFDEALSVCGSENPEYELNPENCDIEIEWV